MTDFRKLNKVLKRKPYPIPKIMDILNTIQRFTYASTLDLSMGYYTICLDKKSQSICTTMTPWGKYSYMRLPMGILCAPDIFQDRMSALVDDLEQVYPYLDDLLLVTGGSLEDHLKILECIL